MTEPKVSASVSAANLAPAAFEWPVRVYYEDTDAGGVVYYANYLRFMERARSEWLRSLGYEQDQLMQDPGVLFVVRRTEVDYLQSARFNQQLLVRNNICDLRGASLVFEQSVVDAQQGTELCRGKTQVACVRADSLSAARIPRDMLAQFKALSLPSTSE